MFTINHIHTIKFADCGSGTAEILQKLNILNTKIEKIMATQAQLAEQLNTVTAQIAKIGTESTKTLQKVTELEEALANQDSVSPALQTAFDNLKAQVTVVDDLIPDAQEG